MNRRTLVKQMIWMGAGIAFLPSCVYKQDKLSIQLRNFQINPDQEKLLFALANTIIPATDTPGAAELGAHLFALKMVDDCMEQPAREKFTEGLKAFQQQSATHLGKSFADADQKARSGFLEISIKKEPDSAMASFLQEFKRLVTRGYTQSEYVMTKLLPYKLVPGKYKSCIPFSELTQKS